MNQDANSLRITLRIPGDWSHPKELLERLPMGIRLEPDRLLLPDGAEFEFIPMPADGQFPDIFRSACRRPPTAGEAAVLARYRVNVGLSGAGGTLESALAMMQAGSAIVRAGGAGVFIDNCAMAHGGKDWLAMTEDGGSDAISFAFVSIIRGKKDVYTLGMHVLGLPDLLMQPSEIDEQGERLVGIIRYMCAHDRPIDVGHMLADELGPLFQVVGRVNDDLEAGSPMHNPYGRLKIMSAKDIAQDN